MAFKYFVGDKLTIQWKSNSISEVNIYLIGDAVKKLLATQLSDEININYKEFTITKEWFNSLHTVCKLRVESVDNAKFAGESPEIIIYEKPIEEIFTPSPVAPPIGLSIESVIKKTADGGTYSSPSELKILWTDNSTSEDVFVIERMDSMNDWATIKDNVPKRSGIGTAIFFNDTNLIPNMQYSYRILSKNGNITGDYSTEASASTGPSAVEIFNVESVSQNSSGVRLIWEYIDENIKGFEIQRFRDTWITISNSGGISRFDRSYEDFTPAGFTDYDYRIRAVNSFGNSNWSGIKHIKTKNALSSIKFRNEKTNESGGIIFVYLENTNLTPVRTQLVVKDSLEKEIFKKSYHASDTTIQLSIGKDKDIPDRGKYSYILTPVVNITGGEILEGNLISTSYSPTPTQMYLEVRQRTPNSCILALAYPNPRPPSAIKYKVYVAVAIQVMPAGGTTIENTGIIFTGYSGDVYSEQNFPNLIKTMQYTGVDIPNSADDVSVVPEIMSDGASYRIKLPNTTWQSNDVYYPYNYWRVDAVDSNDNVLQSSNVVGMQFVF